MLNRTLIYLLIPFILLSKSSSSSPIAGTKTFLSGTITDVITGESLIGVTVSIPDLKLGVQTDIEGKFKIENLPIRIITIQISYVGYKSILKSVDLSKTNEINFTLEQSIKEINAVVITASSNVVEKNRTPIAITLIPKTVITQNSSSNIIDALATQPGISQITTGSGISKPVIRGLGYNRVIVLNDGIRQEGQQWGDEHGIEIDEYGIDNVEVLKGPASLMYGSDAMAGVINMISAPSLAPGKISGEFLTEYQSNNGLIGLSANSKGNNKGFIWDVRLSGKAAHAYENKNDGYVYNSGFKEQSVHTTTGINRSWGYSHLIFSYYHLTPGIVEGNRDSITGKFTKEVPTSDTSTITEIVSENQLKNYDINNPYQQIDHLKIIWDNSVIIKNGTLKSAIGYQQNSRKEFANIFKPNEYGLYFDLRTINYELKYHFPEFKKTNLSIGVNGMIQNSANRGTEFLVPAYHLFDGGLFVVLAKNLGKIDFSGGIRYDIRNVIGDDLYLPGTNSITTGEHLFKAFNSTFKGTTGSAGIAWNFTDHFYSKLNFSFGFRAPNIAELGANGIHEGTLRYEIGNIQLKAEHSTQIDLSFGYNTDHLTIEIDGFNNQIDNFIYLSKLSNSNNKDSIIDGYSVFKYNSGNAQLMGGEIMVDIHPHPLDWLHFENSFSYVTASQKNVSDSTKYLPFTPPAKYTSEIQVSLKKLNTHFKNIFIKSGIDFYFNQNQIFSAYQTETSTNGYQLLHAAVGSDIFSAKRKFCSLLINVSNITNQAYQSHLSRLKYAPENFSNGRIGIFNSGRSINFKLIFPIG